MQIISRGRQGGKTAEAVQWVMADPDRVLLVMDRSEQQRLRRTYGIPESQIMIAQGSRERLFGRRMLQLGVDNIDNLSWRTVLELGRMEAFIELVTETRGF